MSKVITGLHCTVSAVRGFTRGIVTMPLKFSKELDSYSSKPLAPATSEERRRFSTKINKRISNGIIPRLFKAIGLTLIYPIVSAANDVKKALLKAKKNYRRSSSITQRINFQEDKDDYVLDNSDWAKLNNNLKTPPLELGFIEALSRLLRLAFMFIAGLTYSFIRLPAAVISDVIKNFREQKFSAWLIYFLPNLGRSLFSNIYNTTRNWVKDENELFYKDHYARTREFPENGSALLYFIGFLAGIIISPLYATYFAFIKSPEYDMQNPKHYERHREPFFQTLFKSPFRFIKALFSCPFDLAVKLAV
ncbi:MAG TPA: hypothetical protein VHA13_05150, partial [Gammaproteobacteria bacterium]|nr:hypothetical protein [Gammaproteobacteria bacterium]